MSIGKLHCGFLHCGYLNRRTQWLVKKGLAKRELEKRGLSKSGITSTTLMTNYPSLVFKLEPKEKTIITNNVNVLSQPGLVVNRFLSIYLSLSPIGFKLLSHTIYSRFLDNIELNRVASYVNSSYVDIFREFTSKMREDRFIIKYDPVNLKYEYLSLKYKPINLKYEYLNLKYKPINILSGEKGLFSNRLYSIGTVALKKKGFDYLTTARQVQNISHYPEAEQSIPILTDAEKVKTETEVFQNIYETRFLNRYQLNTDKVNEDKGLKKRHLLTKAIETTIENRLFKTKGVNILNLNPDSFNAAKAADTWTFDSINKSGSIKLRKENLITDVRRRTLLDSETVLLNRDLGQKVDYSDTRESHIKSLKSQWNIEETQILKNTVNMEHIKQKQPVTTPDTPVLAEVKPDTVVYNRPQTEVHQQLPDINQLANMVYQEIENRIKLHKERMGL